MACDFWPHLSSIEVDVDLKVFFGHSSEFVSSPLVTFPSFWTQLSVQPLL